MADTGYLDYIDYNDYRYSVGDIVKINNTTVYTNSYTNTSMTNSAYASCTFKIIKIADQSSSYWSGSSYFPINPIEITVYSGDSTIVGTGGCLRTSQLTSGGMPLHCSIKLNANGGTLPDASNLITRLGTGDYCVIQGYLPTRTGYTFKGYYTATSGGEQVWNSSGLAVSGTYWNGSGTSATWKWTAGTSLTVYAQWEINTYTVTFNKNGGSGGTDSVNIIYGTPKGSYPSITLPNRTGYTFKGYYTSASGGIQYYDSSGNSLREWDLDANTTLYAQWQICSWDNTIHHILSGFKNNEGNYEGNNAYYLLKNTIFNGTYQESYSMDESKCVTVPNGCYISSFATRGISGEYERYNIGTKYVQRALSDTFDYFYSPNTYKIEYIMNGGLNHEDNPKSYNILYGVTFQEPIKEGWTFDGWYHNDELIIGINDGCNATFASSDDLYSTLLERTSGDFIIQAYFSKKITLTYDANGGNCSITYDETTLRNSQTEEKIKIIDEIPIRIGYTFKGWSTEKDSQEISYVGGDSIVVSEDVTLYAVWEVANVAYYKRDNLWCLCNTYYKTNGNWYPAIMFEKTNDIWCRSVTN